MLEPLYASMGGNTGVAAVVLSVALMLLTAFLFTRLTGLLHLPNVTGYILAGVCLGPCCLKLVPQEVSAGMGFISDVALAFIAFSAGEYFRLSSLKENGGKVAVITLLEALTASVVVFVLTFFILRLGFVFSLILSALASSTAPASTMMTIRQTKAKGPFVNILLSTVAFDDVVGLVTFSVAISVGLASLGGEFGAGDILLPIVYNLVLIAAGFLFGLLLKFLMKRRSTDNRLLITVALLFAICGVGAAVNVSPLLGCMVFGMTYINFTNDDRLFSQLNGFSPPILCLFFVKSGMDFRIDALFDFNTTLGGSPLLLVGALYFLFRIIGKYAGAFAGCAAMHEPKEIRNCLGLALIPQAGVSIGLAALAARVLGDTGVALQTVILLSGLLYELAGPACAKLALYLTHSYEPKPKKGAPPPRPPEGDEPPEKSEPAAAQETQEPQDTQGAQEATAS